MTVRPLRPVTDCSLGEPLPHQLANRTRAPPSSAEAFPYYLVKKVGLYGISQSFLRLSRYKGQVTHALLTRSPLYWVTEVTFLVRLACVRHAASVDSEPGSNSQVKFAGPTHHIQPKPDLIDGTQLFNAIACLLGSCVVFLLRVVGGSTASHRRLAPPILTNGHPLTLDGSFSACTHYLVFKEPEPRTHHDGASTSFARNR